MQTGGDGVRFRRSRKSWVEGQTDAFDPERTLAARRTARNNPFCCQSSGQAATVRLTAGTPMRFGPTAASWRPFCARTLTAALVIALLLAMLDPSQAADPAPKRVLMLHSFGPRFKPWSDYEQTIRSEISRHRQKPVDFLDHSLVNARLEVMKIQKLPLQNTFVPSTPVDQSISLLPSAHPPPLSSSVIASACFQQRQWSSQRWNSAA